MMSEAASVSLTLDQVVNLISSAKAGGINSMLIGMQIFNNLPRCRARFQDSQSDEPIGNRR
jgi:hypothetical protein